jgi:hypothetical protein
MKKLLSVLAMFVLLVVAPFWGWCYTEGTKSLHIGDMTVAVPEKTPDFIDIKLFDFVNVMEQRLASGARVNVAELVNKEKSVGVIVLIAEIPGEGKVHILALQVKYRDKVDIEFFEDADFMKTGKPSDKLIRVKDSPQINLILEKLGKVTF